VNDQLQFLVQDDSARGEEREEEREKWLKKWMERLLFWFSLSVILS
jgi:hypothetical protein